MSWLKCNDMKAVEDVSGRIGGEREDSETDTDASTRSWKLNLSEWTLGWKQNPNPFPSLISDHFTSTYIVSNLNPSLEFVRSMWLKII